MNNLKCIILLLFSVLGLFANAEDEPITFTPSSVTTARTTTYVSGSSDEMSFNGISIYGNKADFSNRSNRGYYKLFAYSGITISAESRIKKVTLYKHSSSSNKFSLDTSNNYGIAGSIKTGDSNNQVIWQCGSYNVNSITFCGSWYSISNLFFNSSSSFSFVLFFIVILCGGISPPLHGVLSPPPWRESATAHIVIFLWFPFSTSNVMYPCFTSIAMCSLTVLSDIHIWFAMYSFPARQNHFSAHSELIRQNSNFALSDNSLSNRTLFGIMPYHFSIIVIFVII